MGSLAWVHDLEVEWRVLMTVWTAALLIVGAPVLCGLLLFLLVTWPPAVARIKAYGLRVARAAYWYVGRHLLAAWVFVVAVICWVVWRVQQRLSEDR